MILVLFAQMALAQNPEAVTHPKYTAGAIFHADDYPSEARPMDWSGTVVAGLKVNVRGRVDACTIVGISGHKLLDDTTCRILIERARFKPARDKNGNPVEDTFRTPGIGWVATK